MATQLDRAAIALHMPYDRAHVTISALREVFEQHGKSYGFEQTAKIVVMAAHGKSDDPDVRFAAEWLADLTKKSTGTSSTTQNAESKGKTGTEPS